MGIPGGHGSKVRVQVSVDADHHDRFKAIAAERGVPITRLVDAAMRTYLAREEKRRELAGAAVRRLARGR